MNHPLLLLLVPEIKNELQSYWSDNLKESLLQSKLRSFEDYPWGSIFLYRNLVDTNIRIVCDIIKEITQNKMDLLPYFTQSGEIKITTYQLAKYWGHAKGYSGYFDNETLQIENWYPDHYLSLKVVFHIYLLLAIKKDPNSLTLGISHLDLGDFLNELTALVKQELDTLQKAIFLKNQKGKEEKAQNELIKYYLEEIPRLQEGG